MKTTAFGLIVAANAVAAAPAAAPLNLNLGGIGINLGGSPAPTTTKAATLPTGGGNLLNNILDPILGNGGLLNGVKPTLPSLPSVTLPGGVAIPTLPSLPGSGGSGNLLNNVLDPILGNGGLLNGAVPTPGGGGNLLNNVLDPILGSGGGSNGGNLLNNVLDPILGSGGLLNGAAPSLPSISLPSLPLPSLPGVPGLPGGTGLLSGVLTNLLPNSLLSGALNPLFTNLFGDNNGAPGNLLSTNILGLQLDVDLSKPVQLNLSPVAIISIGGPGSGTTQENPFTSTIDVRAVGSEVYNKNKAAPGPADAIGLFKFGLNGPLNTICYNITVFNMRSPYQSPWLTATHIHDGVRKSDGVPRIVFPDPVGDEVRKNSVGCMTGPFKTGAKDKKGVDYGANFKVSQIEANPKAFFADTHTVANRHGFTRAQLG